MTGHSCGTCKHYEQAPMWRRGWCRNPMLYSPQQSHLVEAEDLDCERGMGNYWESLDAASSRDVAAAPMVSARPLPMYQTLPRQPSMLTTQSGQPVYSVSGSSGYSGDPDDPDDVGPPSRGRLNSGGGDLDYYSDERYWTDYLRILLPIAGVLLMLALGWIWARSFFDDDGGAADQARSTGSPTLPLIIATPGTPTSRSGATGTAQVVVTAPPGTTAPTGTGATNTPAEAPSGAAITVGSTVQVANTGGEGVNLRSEASTTGEVVSILLDGTELVVTGGPIEGENFVWWEVEGEAGSGFIVEDFLTVVE